MLDGSVVRIFHLTNEPGGLGLNCSSAGLTLAGAPFFARPPRDLCPDPLLRSPH